MSYVEKANKLTLLITFEKQEKQLTIPKKFTQENDSNIKLSIDDHRILVNGNLKLRGLLGIYEEIVHSILESNKEVKFLTYGLGIQGKLENTSEKNKPINIGNLLNVFPAITNDFSNSEKTLIKNFEISFTSDLNEDELFVSISSGKNKISLFSAISHDIKKVKNVDDMKELFKKADKSFKSLVSQEEVNYDAY